MTATTALAPTEPTPATTSANDTETRSSRGHIGRIVTANSTQVEVADATHKMLLTNGDTAAVASDAIAAVVEAVRTGTPVQDEGR